MTGVAQCWSDNVEKRRTEGEGLWRRWIGEVAETQFFSSLEVRGPGKEARESFPACERAKVCFESLECCRGRCGIGVSIRVKGFAGAENGRRERATRCGFEEEAETRTCEPPALRFVLFAAYKANTVNTVMEAAPSS